MTGARAGQSDDGSSRHGPDYWRRLVWGGAALLLVLPWLAMQVLAGMRWDETDFIVWGVMVAVAAIICEIGARLSDSIAYRLATVVAAGAGFLLVWINLAVGFIGNEDNPANLMYVGVLGVAVLGALAARFRPTGMAIALLATAAAHGVVGLVAQLAALDTRMIVLLANGFFVLVWLIAAGLYRSAARRNPVHV